MVAFATQVKRRRGTTAQNDAFTGAEGEIVVDTQKHTLRVHDGETLGGFEMARQADLNDKAATSYVDSQLALKADADLSNVPDNYDYVVESQEPTSSNGYTWYRKYKSGWVEQGGKVGALNNSRITVTLPVAMANNSYVAIATGQNASSASDFAIAVISPTTTQITLGSNANYGNGAMWQVSGMSAQ